MNERTGAGAGGQSDGDAGLARTLVLNALRDRCGGMTVLADDRSGDVVEEAFAAAVDEETRERFRRELAALEGSGEDPPEETGRFLSTVADDVLEELVARDVDATLVHEATVAVGARDAALYTFLVTHDPAALDALALTDPVRAAVDAGAAALAEGDDAAAAERFDEAVVEAGGGTGGVAARVLAAHASHRAGDDAGAIDYVEETLHLDTRVWPAKLVGYAADHRYPEKFRTGKLGARVFFRWNVAVPDGGSATASVGPAGGEVTPLAGRDECMPVDRLSPETTLRLELRGPLPAVPTVETYYLATGVVDLEVDEVRSVETVLASGPGTADATERIRFERPGG